MDLGTRQIRTAGKGSGSIELTLPAELRDLVGVPCRVTLRDGSRPDIILRPDLARAQQAFAALWQPMTHALLAEGATPFPAAAFTFGLTPRSGQDAPYLCWRDGLVLAGPAPFEADAVCRTLGAFAQAMAPASGIAPALSAGFGAVCGTRLTGTEPEPEVQEACDIAALHLPEEHPPLTAAAHTLDHRFWTLAEPMLRAIAGLFAAFSADPANHARLRTTSRLGGTTGLDMD